jgi:nucleoside-diphosphate-sugar epimerase
MRALVTGAGGFLGQYIVEQLLARGDQVRAFARGHYPALAALGAQTLRGDLRDRAAAMDACRDVDVVFHAAGIAGIWGPWEQFHGINTVGTRNIIAGCLAHSVPKLVYTSSPSVTFDGGDQCGVDESVPYPKHWLCHYAETKAMAEQEVLAANHRHGLATCALRPHLIWGPRDTQLIPRLIARAKAGQLRRVGAGDNKIDVIYVENAAAAHLAAASALTPGGPVAGKAYFISQGEPVTCWPWIDQLLGRAGLPPVTKGISAAAAWKVGHAMELMYRALGRQSEPRMTRFLAAQLSRSHYYNITAARRDFGFAPAISTAEGLARTEADLRRWTVGQ